LRRVRPGIGLEDDEVDAAMVQVGKVDLHSDLLDEVTLRLSGDSGRGPEGRCRSRGSCRRDRGS
jgi:hypothetical protein